jgi:putative peptide zinc metalloprotease protein
MQKEPIMSLSLTTQFELNAGAQIVAFDSSTQGKNYRVELTDGRHFQVNEKLYHLLDALRTAMTLPDLAAAIHQRTGQSVALDQLQQLGAQLVEQGVVTESGKTPVATPTESAPTSYMGLHYRKDLLSPEVLAPMARLLQGCFHKGVAAILVALIAVAHLLAYREMGFPPNLDMTTISWPLLYGVILISIFFHELGHLAACHRWGAPHGPLGFGLYFFNPVFYVDVTAAWRLNRFQRAAVDAGGIYIQLLFAPICLALFWATGDATYLLAIMVIDLILVGNLEPFMKLDGYWLLSDLTGVPNLHARTGEAAKRMWGWLLWRLGRRSVAPAATAFSQWAGWVRVVIFVYIALSIALWPVLIVAMLPLMIDAFLSYPALWQGAMIALAEAGAAGDVGAIATQLQVLFLPTLTLLNTAFLLKIAWNRRQQNQKVAAAQTMQMQPA